MTINFGPLPKVISRDMLRRGNPLLRDLSFLSFPGLDGVDLVSGRRPIARAGMYGTTGAYGNVAIAKVASGNCLNYGGFFAIPEGSNNYTIAALAMPANTARITHVFSQYDAGSSNNPHIALALNSDLNGASIAGAFACFEYQSGFKVSADSNNTRIDGDWHIFAGERNGATQPVVYFDGLNVVSGQGSVSGNISGADPTVNVSGNIGLDRAADYPVLMVAVWKRTLSAVEHLTFASYPWRELINWEPETPCFLSPEVVAGGFFGRHYYEMIGHHANV